MSILRKVCVCAGIAAVGAAFAEATVSTNGTEVTVSVPEGESYVYPMGFATPVTRVVKTGAGTAQFKTACSSFTGSIAIQEGIADFNVLGSYGAGPITVSSGAQMKVSHTSPGQGSLAVPGTVTIAGSGPDGKGAIYFTGSGMGDQMFKNLVLSADATVGGNRHGYTTIDFQNHILTWVGGNLMVSGHTWKNFAGLVHNGTADICFQGNHTTDAAAAGKPITVNSGYVSFWGPSKVLPYSLTFNASSSLRVNYGTDVKWSGPITVAEGKTLEIQTNSGTDRKITLSGVLGGAGKIVATGGAAGKIYLDNTANSWTGGFQLYNVYCYPKAPGSLPGYDTEGKVTVSSGILRLVKLTGWTDAAMKALNDTATVGGSGWLSFDYSPDVVTQAWDSYKAQGYIYSGSGVGEVHVPNILVDSAKYICDGANVRFGGDPALSRRTADFRVNAGKTILDASKIQAASASFKMNVGNTAATLVLTNGAQLMPLAANVPLNAGSISLQRAEITSSGTGHAVIEVNDNSSFTGVVYATEAKAVLNIRGGELVQVSGPTADGYFSYGSKGYVYINQTGGQLLGRAHTGLMRQGSTGIYHLKGGEFAYIPGQSGTCNFTLSRGYGMGVLHQTGGVHNTPGHALYMGVQAYSDTTGGLAIATLDGPNALMKVNYVDLGVRLTNFTSIVNLNNGGVLNTRYIEHNTTATRVGSWGYVNFNGGVFRPSGENADIFGSNGKNVKRATVFRKGAVFDTADFNCGVGSPYLQAPSGKGIETIEIPASAAKTGYYGSPEVVITGDGTGATAFCEYDDKTGTIGPITITCPGWDYTTATAKIRTANRSGWVTLNVALAEQASGGLVKTGAKMLTLKGTNTYTGDTIVSNGTLRLLTANCIPVSNTVLCAGGTVDLNGVTTHKLGAVGGYGVVSNGTVEVQGLRFKANDVLDNRLTKVCLDIVGTVNFAEGANVAIEDPEALEAHKGVYTLASANQAFPSDLELAGLAAPWKLVRINDGKTLKLVYPLGTTLLVR